MNVKEIRRINLRVLARAVGGVTQLANRLSKSQSQISHLIGTHPVKNIGDKIAAQIERVFNKPHGWLDHEQTEIQEEGATYQINAYRVMPYRVPLLNWQEVQSRFLEPTRSLIIDHAAHVLTHIKTSPQAIAVRVEGDSMEAPNGISFCDGAIIIVDPELPAKNGTYVLAKQNATSQVAFKQFVIDGNRRFLSPLNLRYPITEVTPHVILCGVVRAMLMEFA